MGDMVWKDAEKRGEIAVKLLKEQLKFDNVTVYVDKTKAEIDDILNDLRQLAMNFEDSKENKGTRNTLAIGIINIGHRLDPQVPIHKPILQTLGVKSP